ncbi:hypothetical protein E5288_WYG011883 [Bos mutus]|uniref:Uncharacterized protein n=1 Tax=Bos mutus TaxID=72004 RepID=A0A6B0QUP5_9CETA|nr:hypothetical protein [Bos mutus]
MESAGKLDIHLKKKLRKTVTSLSINSEYAELMKHPEKNFMSLATLNLVLYEPFIYTNISKNLFEN